MSGIVRAVHQSSSKLGDTPLARLDLFESLPSRRFGCRASTTNSTTKSRSTSLYNAGASSRGGCRALQLYSAPERSTSLQLYSALHSTSSTPSLRNRHPKRGIGEEDRVHTCTSRILEGRSGGQVGSPAPDKGHDRLAARCTVDSQLHWRSHLSLATFLRLLTGSLSLPQAH